MLFVLLRPRGCRQLQVSKIMSEPQPDAAAAINTSNKLHGDPSAFGCASRRIPRGVRAGWGACVAHCPGLSTHRTARFCRWLLPLRGAPGLLLLGVWAASRSAIAGRPQWAQVRRALAWCFQCVHSKEVLSQRQLACAPT